MSRYTNVRNLTLRANPFDVVYATIDEVTGFLFCKHTTTHRVYQKHRGGPWKFVVSALCCPPDIEKAIEKVRVDET